MYGVLVQIWKEIALHSLVFENFQLVCFSRPVIHTFGLGGVGMNISYLVKFAYYE